MVKLHTLLSTPKNNNETANLFLPSMSKKANPASIGLFIILGLALLVGGLIVFSSGKLFGHHQKFILYFDSSLKGLNQGAPVKFRGVTIGSVDQVLIRHNQAERDFFMPVIIEIDEKLAQSKSDRQLQVQQRSHWEELIRRGLRAKLDTESLVTGILYVELDMLPNEPAPVFHQLTPEYPEIPTVTTEIQQLMANLAGLDIRGLTEKLDKLLARLDMSLAQVNIPEINSGITNLLGSANRLFASPDLGNSLAALRQTLTNASTLLKKVDNRVDPLADSAAKTLETARKTLSELNLGIRSLNGMLESDAPLRTELNLTLEQLSNAARAISALAEFLEAHPNAVLTGRKPRNDN